MDRLDPLRALPALWLACAASFAHAQLLEDVDVHREGRDAVASIRFVTPVQMQRTVGSRSGDLVQVYYQLLPTADTLRPLPGERRLAGGGTLPQIAVTEEPDEATGATRRKVVVRFSSATRFRVRPGRERNTIDIVLPGLGDAVPLVPPKAGTAAAPPGRYVVTVFQSTRPDEDPPASIPSALQDKVVFSSRRMVDGHAVYAINVGYFDTEEDARRALQVLVPRFPAAQVVALQPPAAAAPQAAAPQPPVPQAAAPQAAAPQAPSTELAPAAAPAEVEAQAAALLAQAEAALAKDDTPAAIEALNALLNLPPNGATPRAMVLIGEARLKAGDAAGARREFELFLKLHPEAAEAPHVRELLAKLPAQEPARTAARAPRKVEPVTVTSGSLSTFYFGGRSKVRTQEFEDSPIGGAASLLSDATLTGTDLRQVQTSADLSWRHRDADVDQRFVFRDSFTADRLRDRPDRNRLSALYYEHRLPGSGTGLRVGRQSPTGYGVLYRFDGVQGSYGFAPKWKVNGVWGKPTDRLLDTRRVFYGASLEAEALTPELSGNVYGIQQSIDGEVDRRAVGTELRWFRNGVSASGQLDYDIALRGLNIATVQGTWQLPDTTTYNALFDRRAVPIRNLGNLLFFQDPTATAPPRTIADLLGATPMDELRKRASGVTPMQTQASLGFTRPVVTDWQAGADVRFTKVDPIPAVPVILPNGQPGTGNLWSAGVQVIGSNLFSLRDTHVFNVTYLTSPTFHGTLFAYNNLTSLNGQWQLEPALRYYTQDDTSGTSVRRWTPVMRTIYRMYTVFTLEGELTYELTHTTGRLRSEDANRLFFYFGGRYQF